METSISCPICKTPERAARIRDLLLNGMAKRGVRAAVRCGYPALRFHVQHLSEETRQQIEAARQRRFEAAVQRRARAMESAQHRALVPPKIDRDVDYVSAMREAIVLFGLTLAPNHTVESVRRTIMLSARERSVLKATMGDLVLPSVLAYRAKIVKAFDVLTAKPPHKLVATITRVRAKYAKRYQREVQQPLEQRRMKRGDDWDV